MHQDTVQSFYPLSPLQEGMLFDCLASKQSDLYFNQCQFTIRGSLDVTAFREAWAHVVTCNDVLRTFFVWEEVNSPVQVVERNVDLPFVVHDLRDFEGPQKIHQYECLLAQARDAGFDLSKAPLLKLDLLQFADDVYEFVWSFHHLILDGWSAFQVLHQVFSRYEASRNQEPFTLVNPRPYRDFVAYLKRQNHREAEEYWRNRLHGFDSPTLLGDDRQKATASRNAITTGATTRILTPSLTSSLNQFVRHHHTTLNSLVQLAWGMLLSRYGRTRDVVFGAVVSGRPPQLDGYESMVGMFINTIPVRFAYDPEEICIDALKKIQKQRIESEQFDFFPLMQMQGLCDVSRGESLFQSLVMFENYRKEKSIEEMVQSCDIEQVRWFERTALPLTLIVVPGEQLRLSLIYDETRFEGHFLEQILAHLEQLLKAIAAGPNSKLKNVGMLSGKERHQILFEWNDTHSDYPRDEPIHRIFERQVEIDPTAVAVTLEGESVSYHRLNERANQLSHYLASLGVTNGARVAVACERSIDTIVALIAILKTGGVYVPLDLDYPMEMQDLILNETQSDVLLTHKRIQPINRGHSLKVICLEHDGDLLDCQPTTNPGNGVQSSDCAYVIYTSGSTGRPKGTQISHRCVIRLVKSTNYVRLSSSEAILQFSTLAFDASTFEIWGALLNGAHLVCAPSGRPNLHQLAEVIRRHRVSIVWLTSALFNQVIEELPEMLKGVGQVLVGGEALSVHHVRSAFSYLGSETKIINGYGPTESATFACCYTVPRDLSADATSVPIGRPISNTQVYLLDRDGDLVPPGVAGEMYIGGDGLSLGYLNREELNRTSFVASPLDELPDTRLYRTGDICRYLQDGRVEFIGRIDNQVKVRGFRIELDGIEAALNASEDIRQSVVVMREDEPGDKRIVAYVVSTTGEEIALSALRDFLLESLPTYMMPQSVITLKELPLNRRGKVDRTALPPPVRQISHQPVELPQTKLQRTIADVFRHVLKVEDVGLDDNFFDLGGQSLLVMRAHARLKTQFDRVPSITDFFQFPTIRTLAAHLDGNRVDSLTTDQVEKRARLQRGARQRMRKRREGGSNNE